MKPSAIGVDAREKRRREGQRGSALLIVFVFAAFVAIMLYMETPVAAFEAQRQKEELLVMRGNEYAHAIKLYYRKMQGRYPGSIKDLEETNRIRFLRHKYKDPFTGQDDWRLLHAGPGGMLIDSKVQQNPLTIQNPSAKAAGNSSPGLATSTASFPGGSSNAGSSSGSSSSSVGSTSASFGGFASSSSSAPDATVRAVPQRPPAVAANGAGESGAATAEINTALPAPDPGTSLVPATQAANTPGQTPNGLAPVAGATGDTANQQPATNGATPNGAAVNAGAVNGTQPNGVTTPTTATPGTQQSSFGQTTRSTGGVLNSGGLAGVASKAAGHSIKAVNDQTDYSLWEFFYDPRKDATQGISNALSNASAQQQQRQAGGLTVPQSNPAPQQQLQQPQIVQPAQVPDAVAPGEVQSVTPPEENEQRPPE